MDDDDSIRETVSELLINEGYEVDVARNGDEAVALFINSRDIEKPFDVIVMNLHIDNGKNGKQTMEELLKIDPEVKAVLASGYTDNSVMMEYEDHGFKATVTKPYSIDDISSVLDDVIAIN